MRHATYHLDGGTSLYLRLAIAQALEGSPTTDDPIARSIRRCRAAACAIDIMEPDGEFLGSGFHVGEGFVCTASHVVKPEIAHEKHKILLTFDGGKTQMLAEPVVSDPSIDIAILYAPEAANKVPSVTLGNSDDLQVADIVAVIGAPNGFADTCTVGRVSNKSVGLGASAPTKAWESDIMFIDADIADGASGGMVIGADGKVYGSVLGVTGMRAEQGIGQQSVCPSNKIKRLITYLAHSKSGGF